MFRRFLNLIVRIIYKFHTKILSINDSWEFGLTDKQLHFLVIGAIGMAMLFVVYPFFKWLATKDLNMVSSWIYVFTVLVALTLFIEIGQDVTGTGDLEFADIMAGLMGFIVMSGIYIMIRLIFKEIIKAVKQNSNNN